MQLVWFNTNWPALQLPHDDLSKLENLPVWQFRQSLETDDADNVEYFPKGHLTQLA
jgi:hypothetical protein